MSGHTQRLGLFGRGRLGQAVAEAASGPVTNGDSSFDVAWHLGRDGEPTPEVHVVIDASVGEAVGEHLDWATGHGVPLVIAATGWHIDDLTDRVGDRCGVLLAPNGSLTVALMARLARLLGAYARLVPDADGWLLDHHHAGKRDAPSGTALRLAEAFAQGAGVELSVAAVRAGHEVGRHVLGIDTPGETFELHHRARSRATFAHGLLSAARWLTETDRRGVFTMDDVAASLLDPLFEL